MGFFSNLFGDSDHPLDREPHTARDHGSPPDLAFVDVETTGFAYKRHDRVVEIGIVRTDFWGEEQATFESLVDPRRDVGPTHIHGIRAEMVQDAPPFEELTKPVLELLDGTCWVAHNAVFDVNFLSAEFERAGIRVEQVPHECTLTHTRNVFPDLPSKKLERVCKALDIELENHHAALEDAKATRQLLAILRQERPGLVSESRDSFHLNRRMQVSVGQPLTRRQFEEGQDRRSSPMASLLARLPSVDSDDAAAQTYADLLDEALLDRIVSEGELDSLIQLAEDCGLSQGQAEEVHLCYLTNLIRYALLDDVVTSTESSDIERVQKLLGLESLDLDGLIEELREDLGAIYSDPPDSISDELRGKSVCFTGSFSAELDGEHIGRGVAQRLADERGMVVKKSVTKSLDYLVAADPQSQSGKAKKARKYDIPIIAEMEFWRKLGVRVH